MPRILLAEDDRNFGRVLKAELEEAGHAVSLAPDGVEAVLVFIDARGMYDFVVLDIKMPRLDGISALRIIKKLDPEVPVVTISGNAGALEMADAVKAGAIRCLSKPFEIVNLLSEINVYASRKEGY